MNKYHNRNRIFNPIMTIHDILTLPFLSFFPFLSLFLFFFPFPFPLPLSPLLSLPFLLFSSLPFSSLPFFLPFLFLSVFYREGRTLSHHPDVERYCARLSE